MNSPVNSYLAILISAILASAASIVVPIVVFSPDSEVQFVANNAYGFNEFRAFEFQVYYQERQIMECGFGLIPECT